MNVKEKSRNVLLVLVAVASFSLFIQCAVDEPLEVMSNSVSIAERISIAEVVSGIEESSQIYHSQMMELQKLFDISPEAQEAFQKAKLIETPLHYSYTSEGEFIWSTETWAGGRDVLSSLSIITNSHNVRKLHYLEQLVATDDKFELLWSGPHIHGVKLCSLVMRGFWSVSVWDDNALLQRLSLLAQIEKAEAKERGVANHALFNPNGSYAPVRWPTVTGKNTLFFRFGTVKPAYQSIVNQVITEINNSGANIRLVNIGEPTGWSTWCGYARDCRDFHIYTIQPLIISVDDLYTLEHGDMPSTGASHHVSPIATIDATYPDIMGYNQGNNYVYANKTTYIKQILYYCIGLSIGLENEISRIDADQNIHYPNNNPYYNWVWSWHSLIGAKIGELHIQNNYSVMETTYSSQFGFFNMNGTKNFDHNSIMIMTSDYRTIASGNLINSLTGATMQGSNGLSAGDRAMLDLLYYQIGRRNFSDPMYDGW